MDEGHCRQVWNSILQNCAIRAVGGMRSGIAPIMTLQSGTAQSCNGPDNNAPLRLRAKAILRLRHQQLHAHTHKPVGSRQVRPAAVCSQKKRSCLSQRPGEVLPSPSNNPTNTHTHTNPRSDQTMCLVSNISTLEHNHSANSHQSCPYVIQPANVFPWSFTRFQ